MTTTTATSNRRRVWYLPLVRYVVAAAESVVVECVVVPAACVRRVALPVVASEEVAKAPHRAAVDHGRQARPVATSPAAVEERRQALPALARPVFGADQRRDREQTARVLAILACLGISAVLVVTHRWMNAHG